MHELEKALYDHELIVLRVIGEWWELDLTGQQKPACVAALAQTLASLDMTQEMLFLSPEEADAMADLIAAGGRMPAASFERQHGGLRNMGTTLGTGETTFYSVAGNRGRNRDALNVFRLTGAPCPRCRAAIVRMIVGQRSTHICPNCQVR